LVVCYSEVLRMVPDMSGEAERATDVEGLSPIVRALRLTTDEVQFGRVLAAICQDPEVAEAFVSAVIDLAAGGNRAAQRFARMPRSDVRCIDEQRLEARVSRRALRHRAKDLGRVDLEFSGSDGWQLLVELKLDADFGDMQVERYVEQGIVAAIVRNPDEHAPRSSEVGWVGAASWSSLVPRLRTLPVDSRWRQEWLNLIEVMQADGDFAPVRPDGVPEVIAARELLADAASTIREGFCEQLRRSYGADAEIAIRRLRLSKPSGKRGPWAGFNINTPDDGPWLYIEIRNLWSRAPRIRVWHWHWPERPVRREVRAAYERVPDPGSFRLLRGGAMFDQPHFSPVVDHSDIAEEIVRRLGRLVQAGVFGPDLRYQNKHYHG
jgi:hypothetical protein